jgi:hypothetical protein
MATLKEIQDSAKATQDSVFTEMVSRQDAFIKSGSRQFLQLPDTPATVPPDGKETAPDLRLKYASEPTDWQGLGVGLPATLPCTLRVDVYEDSAGKGFTLTATIEERGIQYQRVRNFGHLVDRETGWIESEIEVL